MREGQELNFDIFTLHTTAKIFNYELTTDHVHQVLNWFLYYIKSNTRNHTLIDINEDRVRPVPS